MSFKMTFQTFQTFLTLILNTKNIINTFRKPKVYLSSLGFAVLLWFYFCLPNPLFDTPYSTVIEDAHGRLLSAKIARDYQWRFPQGDSIPQKFAQSIVLFEDEYFFSHPGVNPVSMWRALRQNIRNKRITSGGSTISMQVIRLSRQGKQRTIFEKFYEIILAFRLELSYSKQEILNMYVSHAPFGGNVVGLEAASWRYFNRPAYMLSWGEAAALAVLPNAPALVFPGKNEHILQKKRNRLLRKLLDKGYIDKISYELAQLEQLPQKPHPLPNTALHLLNKTIADGNEGEKLETTLNGEKQKHILSIAQSYTYKYASNYIHNIAIIVADTKTGNILAYIGNGNKNHESHVDNCISKRSSGSVLKPFLYASMLNNGQMLPHTLLSDIPTRIGGYAPQNFEKTFEGVVPASDALARSLNIPFVRMLQDYGVAPFLYQLRTLGFSSIQNSADYYGLSLILGGAEISLWESVSVYASMARSLMTYNQSDAQYSLNDYRSIQYTPSTNTKPEYSKQSKISAGAIYSTLQALSMVNRPWGEIGWEQFASAHTIAWKTGTSFGHRDAWSIGVTPEYTVGVWVGNSSGEGRPGLTGLSHAAPIMFEIFKYLNPKSWFRMPSSDMVRIEICKESGNRASTICPHTQQMYVPTKGTQATMCTYHQTIHVDSTQTYRVSAQCYPVFAIVPKTYFILPPTQEWFYKRNHPNYTMVPDYMQGCTPVKEQVLDLIHPDNNSALYIPQGLDGEAGKIIFEAVHKRPKTELFWHIDNEYITSTKGIHTIEIAPTPGKHTLMVIDAQGNSVQRRFSVVGKK